MRVPNTPLTLVRAARSASSTSEFCTCFAFLSIQSRPFSVSSSRHAVPSLHAPAGHPNSATSKRDNTSALVHGKVQEPSYKELTPAQRAARAAERAREKLQEQQQKYLASRKLGGLAENSFFADKPATSSTSAEDQAADTTESKSDLARRNIEQMSFALNPRPNARVRWQRKMLIRHIRRRGRLPRALQIARTERDHLSKSHFFKTSMKKLAPLARQIAGKSIDEAILQMRFSKKKAAREVRAHLIQAKNEAVVAKGMGLGALEETTDTDSPVVIDSGISPPTSSQNPTKSTKPGHEKSETEIYVAQAWVNRGPYGMEPEFRARGRVNILRPPWTGISVLLKEEKTRTRERAEKEAKAIKKRTGRTMWVQLPDRPITRQSQYVLW